MPTIWVVIGAICEVIAIGVQIFFTASVVVFKATVSAVDRLLFTPIFITALDLLIVVHEACLIVICLILVTISSIAALSGEQINVFTDKISDILATGVIAAIYRVVIEISAVIGGVAVAISITAGVVEIVPGAVCLVLG